MRDEQKEKSWPCAPRCDTTSDEAIFTPKLLHSHHTVTNSVSKGREKIKFNGGKKSFLTGTIKFDKLY